MKLLTSKKADEAEEAENNTHKATLALLPSTTHPQSWVEPHIHVRTGKSLLTYHPSICPSTIGSCRSSVKD